MEEPSETFKPPAGFEARKAAASELIDECLYLSSLSAAVTLVSALPFEHMNLTPRHASLWFWPTHFPISAFAGFHFKVI